MESSADILTIEEVAKVLRCSKAHVQNALRGKLHGVPRLMHLAMGRRKVVRREWLQQWLEGLRPGEILALRLSDMFESHLEIVRRVYKGTLDTPRGRKGKRTARKAALSTGKAMELALWRSCLLKTGPDDYLFPSERNTPLYRDNVWYRGLKPKLAQSAWIGLRSRSCAGQTQACLGKPRSTTRFPLISGATGWESQLHGAFKARRRKAERGIQFETICLGGLPVRKPTTGEMLYERRNGDFVLQITGHPNYGLPFGQARIVPIYLATLAVRQQSQTIRFRTASEMLETFGMHKGGKDYRRLVATFERIFGATIFFGTDTAKGTARVVQRSRFSFFQEAQIWYSRDSEQYPVSDQFENMIVLSDEFYREIVAHPIPADLEAVKVLASAPAVLDLFMWLSYRCFVAKGKEMIPLFGAFGLASQIGSIEYARPRRFREKLEKWLESIRVLWPECPARISSDGMGLIVDHAYAVLVNDRGNLAVTASGGMS